MKKNTKSLLTLSVLGLGLVLVACGMPAGSSSSGDPSSQLPATTSEATSSSSEANSTCSHSPEYIEVEVEVEVEVEKKFGISVNAAEGTTVSIVDPQESYSAGSSVSFTVSVEKSHLELEKVTYDGNVVFPDAAGVYSVVVVNRDAAIETSTRVRGEENLFEVADVDASSLPASLEDFKAVLESARSVEAKYLKSASYEYNFSSSPTSATPGSLTATVGLNDVVVTEGKNLPYDSNNLYSYARNERGIFENRLYDLEDSTAGVTSSKGLTVKEIVSDETETLLASQVKESEAELSVTTSGFVDSLLNPHFSSSTYSFLTTDSYGWKEIKFSSALNEDGKSYTASASAYYSSSDHFVSLSAVVDGDGFVNSFDLTINDYNYSDVESYTVTEGEADVTYHRPVEGAEPATVYYKRASFERGYRSTMSKTDIKQYATTDYDVKVDYRLKGEYYTTTVGEDNTVYNSSELKFRFRQKEESPVLVLPTLVGAKEEGFITFDEYNTPIVSNVGDFTLLFDNGFGVIKEVPLTSVRPAAKTITASLSSSLIYNGESVTLTSSINPAGADQSVTVELKEGATAEVEITQNEDGTYDVKGVTNGEGTIVVTSVANSVLVYELPFTVEDKPTKESITTKLTSFTFEGTNHWYEDNYVNFYEDGTGEWRCDYMYAGDVVAFNWTLTDTFDLELSNIGAPKRGYGLVDFGPFVGNGFDLTFDYNGGTEYTLTLEAGDSKIEDISSL